MVNDFYWSDMSELETIVASNSKSTAPDSKNIDIDLLAL